MYGPLEKKPKQAIQTFSTTTKGIRASRLATNI
jgi:hypothetical protein